jgi:CheY-like chemotaxis protein
MGGDVTVKSVPGESSVFTIKIPAVVSEPVRVPAEDAQRVDLPATTTITGPASGRLPPASSSVLVIDDDETQRDLIRRFLVGEGFSVHTASDGEEGIRLAQRLLPAAITLDVMMPGLDGWTVLSMLKADPSVSSIPVIMLTMMDDRKRGYALGAADYITKPTDRKRLAQVLKRYSCPYPPCPILVIEEDGATRRSMVAMLEHAGWTVSTAESGPAAKQCVAQNRPNVILLDVTMPTIDGFAFAEELHGHPDWRAIPIVVLTPRDLTADELRRLNGNVQTVIDSAGGPGADLMDQVRNLLADCAVPAAGAGELGGSVLGERKQVAGNV